jgi:glutamate racemase
MQKYIDAEVITVLAFQGAVKYVSNQLPIGVFDSGVGGLTVASAIKAELPNETITYFGDTARCPYGDKTPEQVLEYSTEICDFLVQRGVKMLVVACNTATAVALPALQQRYHVPVLGVVRPGARAAVRATETMRIGVIGTAVTVKSGVYERAIKSLLPKAEVYSLACPEFVPLVERGETSGKHVERIVQERLLPLQKRDIDTLILGCTHYPHLESVIQRAVGDHVRLISSAYETAREVKAVLSDQAWTADRTEPAVDQYFTSGDGVRMEQALQKWMRAWADDTFVIHVGMESLTCSL